MEESEIAKAATRAATEAVRQVGGGILAPFFEGGRSRRRMEELQADVNAIQKLRDSGIDVSYFRGLAMEMEAERQANNVNSTLAKADALIDWYSADPNNVDPEFQWRWINEVRNVSDDMLQDLWAKLLAGEFERPGSVSQSTMSVTRDLTREVAEQFRNFCSIVIHELGRVHTKGLEAIIDIWRLQRNSTSGSPTACRCSGAMWSSPTCRC